MPVKTNLTKEIKCRCKKNTIVDVEPATAYSQLTRFQCDCGRTYYITDYHNAITTYREISAEEDDAYQKIVEEDKKKHKISNPTEEGRRKYRVVESFLEAQTEEYIAGVERQRTFHQLIDKDFVIETLLEHCRYEDNLLDELYEQYIQSLVPSIDFHASGDQAFTETRDWYIIDIVDAVDAEISRVFSSKEVAKDVLKKLTEDTGNYDRSYAIISVPKGTDVVVPE